MTLRGDASLLVIAVSPEKKASDFFLFPVFLLILFIEV